MSGSFKSAKIAQHDECNAAGGDPSQPMRDQYLSHMITVDQSESSIHVRWSLSASANQRPASRSMYICQLSVYCVRVLHFVT